MIMTYTINKILTNNNNNDNNSTDTLFMDKDSIFLLRYAYIRDRLRSGEIELL
jgi:hypothetical protein